MCRAVADTPALAALGLLLGGLSRRTLTLQTLAGASPSPSAAPRAVISTTHLLLPAAVMQDATLARAAIAHAAAHLLYSSPAQAAGTLKPLGLAVASMIEDARVEALLMQRLPGVRRWFLQAQPAHCLFYPSDAADETPCVALWGTPVINSQQQTLLEIDKEIQNKR